MVVHQAKGVYLPPALLASLAKRLQKAEAILVIEGVASAAVRER
jgi:hypothetical protein